MTHSSKSLLIILSITALLLLAIVVGGVYYIREMNNKTSELLHAADEAAGASLLAQSVREVQRQAQADIETFENITLTDDKSIFLIEEVESAGEALDLDTRIASVQNVESATPEEPNLLKLSIVAVGEWSNVFSYLQALESLAYRVSIESADLDKEEDNWRLSATISVHLFK